MTNKIGDLLTTIAFALLFILCLAFVSIRATGLATYVVTGGSMEPSIQKGSLVLVQPVSPSAVKLGDVITFQQFDQTTTHRVIEVGRNAQGPTFVTKGDANTVADPGAKAFPGQVGVVRASLPTAGYLIASVQAYWRLALTLIAALVFFACAAALIFRKQPSATEMPAPRLVRRPVPVMVTVDADEAWNAHLAWLARSQQRTQRVA
ncbi:MAG TPA: signal peptidase I [Candidatus Limnocylindria bacterium]|nr:signal peptidase I [Candidatus Limnocylindria bacterium]